MLISSKRWRHSFSNPKAFTLIELVVVSAIVLIVSLFILFQQAKFNSSTLLRSLTYSLALSVRQAQVFGVSVRESTPGSGVFSSGYGIYLPSGTITQYYLFPDLNGNGAYDSASEGPPIPTVFTLGNGYVLSKFCATRVGGASQECTAGTATLIDTLTIYFRRPNPDACFATNQASGACASGTTAAYSAAYIQLKSNGNQDTRSIKISSTGQIAVCAPGTDIVTLPVSC